MFLAAINIIPDDWQAGPLNEIILAGATVAALGAISKMVIMPIVRWLRRLVLAVETVTDRLAQIPEHDDRLDAIEEQIQQILEALRPTNGDRRSISDRLDTVKMQTAENTAEIREIHRRLGTLGGAQQ